MTITRRNLLSCCVLALSLGFTAVPAGAGPEPLAVVVATSNSANSLSLYELKRLYMGDKIRIGGKKAIALNRDPKSTERKGFDQSVLGMTPEEAASYWIDRRIRGRSGAPKAVEPAEVLQRVVSKLPGSIGYVRLRDVKPGVKVLKIEGKGPSDAGYPVVVGSSSQAQANHGGTRRHF
jgi:hypothetical protein